MERQAAAVLGGPPAGSSERHRAQHESHNAHFIHLENHNSSLCSLHLTSSQETSTHEFVNRSLLSWAAPSLVFWSLLLICMKHKTSQVTPISIKGLQMWHDIDFLSNRAFGKFERTGWTRGENKISCNGMENEVRSKPDLFLQQFKQTSKKEYLTKNKGCK